jgi:hypothetical protein
MIPHRLLEVQTCILDSYDGSGDGGIEEAKDDAGAADSKNKQHLLLLYWLCYRGTEKEEDGAAELWVSEHPPLPSTAFLRLELRISDEHPHTDKKSIKSNVGTKLLFSNDMINIWEFRIEPGEKCHFHTHYFPYLFTNLSESSTQPLDKAGAADGEPFHQVKGQTIYIEAENLGSHAVLNVGSTTFLQFIVDFKYAA